MKKLLSLLLCMCMLVTSLCVFSLPAVADTSGDYEYTVEDDEAIITGYSGAGGNVTIPATLGGYPVTSIGHEAFYNCKSLTSITIPDSVTEIGSHAFSGCTGLTSITIPDSVTEIGNYAFCSCESLTSITIPDGVTFIGGAAFFDCESLTSITIPDGVKHIAVYAFFVCSSLTNIVIPDSVTSISDHAFAGCTSLTDVYYGGTETEWKQITMEGSNEYLTNATIHFESVGPSIDPTTKPTTAPTTAPAPALLLGDANGDGVVNAKDDLAIRKFICNISSGICDEIADYNEDGGVNMKDVIALRKRIAGFTDYSFCIPTTSTGGGQVALAFADVEVEKGNASVTVPLNVGANDGIWAFLLDLSYDPDVLTFDTAEAEEFYITPCEFEPGKVRLFFDAKGMADMTDAFCTVATVSFDVIGDAGDESVLAAACPNPSSNIDVDYTEIQAGVEFGSVKIVEQQTNPTTSPAGDGVPAELFTLLNKAREEAGVPTLAWNDVLAEEAAYKAENIYEVVGEKGLRDVEDSFDAWWNYQSGNTCFAVDKKGTVEDVVDALCEAYEECVFYDKFAYAGCGYCEEYRSYVIVFSEKPKQSTTATKPTASGDILYGDANSDGAVNMKDVLAIRKCIAGLSADIDLVAADANADGVVNMKDVLSIRKYIAGLIDTLGA